jgi:hypothetical protein
MVHAFITCLIKRNKNRCGPKIYLFSFKLLYINVKRGFTGIFLCMHIMYFDQFHPLYYYFSSFLPPFKQFYWVFLLCFHICM